MNQRVSGNTLLAGRCHDRNLLALWVPNPVIIGVMGSYNGVSLLSAGMTRFIIGVTGSITGTVR